MCRLVLGNFKKDQLLQILNISLKTGNDDGFVLVTPNTRIREVDIKNFKNGDWILMNDINFNNGQLETVAGEFTGSLHSTPGENYTIKNFKITGNGIFTTLSSAHIYDITLYNGEMADKNLLSLKK